MEWEIIAAPLAGAIATALLITYLPRRRKRRIFTKRTPEELVAEFEGLTSISGENALRRHKGAWIHISGRVENVATIYANYFVQMKLETTNTTAELFFPRIRQGALLKGLNVGDAISATGKIENISHQRIVLTKCNLAERRS